MVSPSSVDARVAIVGAGPQGLAAALHLIDADPRLHGDLVVVDPAGSWLRAWDDRFARLEIDHLRSPGVHHPGCDPHQLGEWSQQHGLDSPLPSPYAIPATETFQRFCAHLVEQADLAEHVVPTRVRGIDAAPEATRLTLMDRTQLVAAHVILATDHARRCVPRWVADLLPAPPDSLAHADDVDLRALDLADQHVTIVGGGLTAGHLATGAVARGATVTLICRREVREQMFDTDPGWLGPKHLDRFYQVSDPARRLRLALAARDGGSMPPWMTRQLHAARDAGCLRLLASQRICGAQPAGHRVRLVLGDESRIDADRLWLATGTHPDAGAGRLTGALQQASPARIVDGWPVLDRDLRWPGTNVHLLGRSAVLSIGPAAGNLWGARVGAAKVAAHICGGGPEHAADRVSVEAPARREGRVDAQ